MTKYLRMAKSETLSFTHGVCFATMIIRAHERPWWATALWFLATLVFAGWTRWNRIEEDFAEAMKGAHMMRDMMLEHIKKDSP